MTYTRRPGMQSHVVIVGCGAAGLMAAIQAARAGCPSVLALDGARTLGAKILVSGGGRCNVTHDVVTPDDFHALSRHAVRNVLAEFPVERTVEFFQGLGVVLKREATGKLFPVSDRARTVLDALLGEAERLGVRLLHPWRVQSIERSAKGFEIRSDDPDTTPVLAQRAILATGGRSLPKSGSDCRGYDLARALGHTVTQTFPALVPLTLDRAHPLCALSGLSQRATLELRDRGGRRLAAYTDPVLCTHFGLSGPGVLDVSRAVIAARGSGATLTANWLPALDPESCDRALLGLSPQTSILRWLCEQMPERLARVLLEHASIDPGARVHTLSRPSRRSLVLGITAYPLPVTGDRGFTYAEVTAGGVPLAELRLHSMESRLCPGLHLCGEILDVDGRVGGYNFQWAWATGFLAGRAAGSSDGLSPDPPGEVHR